jgi:hypothetical protein
MCRTGRGKPYTCELKAWLAPPSVIPSLRSGQALSEAKDLPSRPEKIFRRLAPQDDN